VWYHGGSSIHPDVFRDDFSRALSFVVLRGKIGTTRLRSGSLSAPRNVAQYRSGIPNLTARVSEFSRSLRFLRNELSTLVYSSPFAAAENMISWFGAWRPDVRSFPAALGELGLRGPRAMNKVQAPLFVSRVAPACSPHWTPTSTLEKNPVRFFRDLSPNRPTFPMVPSLSIIISLVKTMMDVAIGRPRPALARVPCASRIGNPECVIAFFEAARDLFFFFFFSPIDFSPAVASS